MNRRAVLATLAATLAGCGGYADTGDDGGGGAADLSSEGGDEAIDAPIEDLLLAADDLEGDWERLVTDDENCREFVRSSDDQQFALESCAWLYEDVSEAETEYENRVERVHKLSDRGSPTDEAPDVGAEATRIDGRGDANVVFRDANAVGSLRLEAENLGVGLVYGEVEHENAVAYAVAMHERWRD